MGALAGPHRFARHHSPSPWPRVQARFWGLCGLGWGEVPTPPGSQGTCPHADTLRSLPGRPDVSFQPPVTSDPSTPTTHVCPCRNQLQPPQGLQTASQDGCPLHTPSEVLSALPPNLHRASHSPHPAQAHSGPRAGSHSVPPHSVPSTGSQSTPEMKSQAQPPPNQTLGFLPPSTAHAVTCPPIFLQPLDSDSAAGPAPRDRELPAKMSSASPRSLQVYAWRPHGGPCFHQPLCGCQTFAMHISTACMTAPLRGRAPLTAGPPEHGGTLPWQVL